MGFANVFGVGRVSTLAQSMCNLNALLRRESEILANVPAIGCPKTSAFSNDSLHNINLADRNRASNADRRGLGFGVSSKKRHTPTERRGYGFPRGYRHGPRFFLGQAMRWEPASFRAGIVHSIVCGQDGGVNSERRRRKCVGRDLDAVVNL